MYISTRNRVSLNLNLYRVSELNALGFPALGVCTSLFPLPGLFYFSCEHLLLVYPFLLPTFCRTTSFFSTRNPIALYPLGYSPGLFPARLRRSSRMGNRKCKTPCVALSSIDIVYAIQHMYFARERAITEPLKKYNSLPASRSTFQIHICILFWIA